MIRYEKRTLAGLRAGPGECVQDVQVVGCEFADCRVELSPDPALRPAFVRCELIDCVVQPGFAGALVEDCRVENPRVVGSDLSIVSGAILRRVVLKGHFAINIFSDLVVRHPPVPDDVVAAYNQANREAWGRMEESGDWAVDISGADGAIRIEGIPPSLLRMDPELQGIVLFENALLADWQSVLGASPAGRNFAAAIRLMMHDGRPHALLRVSRTAEDARAQIRLLKELRTAGIVQPA